MKNHIVGKVEKYELKIIKRGEKVALFGLLITLISALINYYLEVDLYIIMYIGSIICMTGIGFVLYIRYILENWKI